MYSGEPQNVALIISYGESRNVKCQTDLSEPAEEPYEIKKLCYYPLNTHRICISLQETTRRTLDDHTTHTIEQSEKSMALYSFQGALDGQTGVSCTAFRQG
jgi:hypothetical protein